MLSSSSRRAVVAFVTLTRLHALFCVHALIPSLRPRPGQVLLATTAVAAAGYLQPHAVKYYTRASDDINNSSRQIDKKTWCELT